MPYLHLPESARSTGGGGNIASPPWWEQRGEGFGPSFGASAKRYGRREVIRERLSSRHPKSRDWKKSLPGIVREGDDRGGADRKARAPRPPDPSSGKGLEKPEEGGTRRLFT
jgi:hypothetical protein